MLCRMPSLLTTSRVAPAGITWTCGMNQQPCWSSDGFAAAGQALPRPIGPIDTTAYRIPPSDPTTRLSSVWATAPHTALSLVTWIGRRIPRSGELGCCPGVRGAGGDRRLPALSAAGRQDERGEDDERPWRGHGDGLQCGSQCRCVIASGTRPMYMIADRRSGLMTIRISAYFSNFRCMKYSATRAALASARAQSENTTNDFGPGALATRSSTAVRMARASQTIQ